MPKHVIEDAQITLGGVDISTRVRRVSLMISKRSPALVTGMTNDWEERIMVDVRAWRASLELFQDYSTGSVHSVLAAIMDSTASSGVPLVIRSSTAIRSVSNPEFSGYVGADGDFGLLDAAMGEANMSSPTLIGMGALATLTSSS
jgi:hypothetical protein